MAYKGKYRPTHPSKYRGNPTNIIYRSLWELKFMKYCDSNSNILEWGSEEVIVPYRSPIDNRYHRYFPDFYIKVKENTGTIKRMIIEIKPQKQCIEPKVQAKWEAAKEFCEDRKWEFKVLTENELGIK